MSKLLPAGLILATILTLVLLVSCRSQSSIQTNDTSTPPQQTELLGESWRLHGSGDYTYIFFRVYNVKLYVKTNTVNNTTTPKVIKLDYLRNIEADVSKKANKKAILLNASAEQLSQHQGDWGKMNAFVENIAANQSLIIKHDVDGLTLNYPHINKTLHIKNPELAQFYVDIWLGKKTIDNKLRNKLLK